ncbi:MAG: helix-turn-helix domain-containing protein [Candidatus ainarchaeum sp.]|nr:helix-turn-helix domain-containing protein [Candidatus ainarchaeum sp.]
MKSSSKESSRNKSNFKTGRPTSLNSEKLEKLLKIYYSKPVSIRVLAKMFGISRMTVWRMVNNYELVGGVSEF